MKIRKRIGAFLLDMFIVMMLSVSLANLRYLNPYKDRYEDAIGEYNEVLDKFDTSMQEEMNNLRSGKAYNLDYKNLTTILNDEVMPSLIKLEKTNIFNYLWYLIIFFLYNIVFAFFNDGQTIGKKIFKLKVVNKDESHVTFPRLIVRSLFTGTSLFFGINFILIIRIFCSLLDNANLLIPLYYLLQILSGIIELSLIITIFTSRGGRLTSDMIAKTEVIDVK